MPSYITKGKDLSAFATKLSAYEKALGEAQRIATESAAREVKDTLNLFIRADAGGDNVLSRFNNGKGAKVGATYGIYGYDHAMAAVKTFGPMPILEDGAKQHAMTSKVATGRRKAQQEMAKQRREAIAEGAAGAFSGMKPMVLPGLGIFRYRVQHPGVKGKGTFSRGARAGIAKARKKFGMYYSNAMTKTFGG